MYAFSSTITAPRIRQVMTQDKDPQDLTNPKNVPVLCAPFMTVVSMRVEVGAKKNMDRRRNSTKRGNPNIFTLLVKGTRAEVIMAPRRNRLWAFAVDLSLSPKAPPIGVERMEMADPMEFIRLTSLTE